MRGHERTNTKNHNKETIQRNNYKESAFNGYIMEWNKEKNAMVKRKVD
jgi:hypothetical protein